MKAERFEDIIVWQKSKEIAVKIYKLFEHNKDFGFRDQILRAAVSIMNNIAEGFERVLIMNLSIFYLFLKDHAGSYVQCFIWLKKQEKFQIRILKHSITLLWKFQKCYLDL